MPTARSLQLLVGALTLLSASASVARSADVVIGVPFWPSAQATAHIISQGLEQELTVTTELRQSGTLGIFVGMQRGQIHVHPEIWLPNLEQVVAKHGGDSGRLLLAENGVAAAQNICVTRQTAEMTGIGQLSELADRAMAARFDSDGDGRGEIWIGASTWSSTAIEQIRAQSYGYAETMELLKAPEDVAMASVDVAVATGRPAVFYCYRPHHVFRLHDIVVLDEPEHDPASWTLVRPEDDPQWLEKSKAGSGWDSSHFHIGYTGTLAESAPTVAAFLENIDFTLDEIVEMSYAIGVEKEAPADFAARWIAENEARVRSWGQ